MHIKTESIIKQLEITLNKSIEDITKEDFNSITYIEIDKNSFEDILVVDSDDLQLFDNLESLSVNGCIIDTKFMNNITNKPTIKKLELIHCDFADDNSDFFKKLTLEELVLNDVIGIDDTYFFNINKLIFINCKYNCIVDINTLDISRSPDLVIDHNNSNIKTLIINEKQLENVNENIYKIIVKDQYDEVLKEIDNV